MPLVKRTIRPTAICRGHITSVSATNSQIHSELELTTNGSLAYVILQLGSLSQYVEDLFAELHRETVGIFHRTCQLGDRVDRLKVKITQLNPTVEEVLLQDINMRKPFKSSVIKDQQIITLATRPLSIQEVYMRCEPPPALQKLNPYRTDGKDSLKFYTDDGYFFELWRIAMQKESKNQIKKHKKSRQPYIGAENDDIVRAQVNNIVKDHEIGGYGVTDLHGVLAGSAQSRQEQQRRPMRGVEARVQPSDRYHYQLQQQQQQQLVMSPNAIQYSASHDAEALRHAGRLNVESNTSEGLLVIASSENNRMIVSDNLPIDMKFSNDSGISSYPESQLIGNSLEGRDCESIKSSSTPSKSPACGIPGVVLGGIRGVIPGVIPGGIPGESNHPTGGDVTRFNYEERHVRGVSELSTKSSTPDSTDYLPPPPTPPVSAVYTPDSPGSTLPPPPPPPLDESTARGDGMTTSLNKMAASPSAGGAAPMKGSPIGNGAVLANGNAGHLYDSADGLTSSEMMTSVGSAGGISAERGIRSDGVAAKMAAEDETTLVRDTRSDLLAAIREGIQLRKVEERRLKTEKRHRQPGRLDVQTIMETAFEMRRKALEENDSEEGEEEDNELEGNWSDED